jgi:nitroimidazol reductase NimA-like FMN-containing flavoprotein (pyridoxamine 5'-phosphate oxidase superfamily)
MRAQQWTVKLLHESRIGHMATSTKDGRPHTVPICYVFNGKTIYSSIDEKPNESAQNDCDARATSLKIPESA